MLPWKTSKLPRGNLVYADGTYGMRLGLQKASGPWCVGNGTWDKVNHVPILEVHSIQSDSCSVKHFNKTLEHHSFNIQEFLGKIFLQ